MQSASRCRPLFGAAPQRASLPCAPTGSGGSFPPRMRLEASIRSAAASIRPRVTNSASSHSAPSASCLSRHLEVVTLAVPVPARAGDTRRAHVEPEFLHAEQGLPVVQRPVLIRGLYGLGARRVGATRRADLVKEPFNAGLGVVAVIRGGRVDRVGGVPPVGEHLAGALDDPCQDGRALVTYQSRARLGLRLPSGTVCRNGIRRSRRQNDVPPAWTCG